MMTIMIHDTTGRRCSAQSRVRRGAGSGLPTACLSTWKRKVVYHASLSRCVTGIRKLLSHPPTMRRACMSKSCAFPKPVHVRQYMRFRKGRLEIVCEHCRSRPH